jgi:hypothetical protein
VDEGVTTVRNLWGFTGLLEGAAALVRDGAVAPSIESASPGVDGPGSPWPQTQLITDPADADALVDRLAAEGWRWMKVYSHSTRRSSMPWPMRRTREGSASSATCPSPCRCSMRWIGGCSPLST